MSVVQLLVAARPLSGRENEFSQWQSRMQTAALASAGCLSCEIWPPNPDQDASVAVLQYDSLEQMRAWKTASTLHMLLADASPLVEGGHVLQLAGGAATEYIVQNCATEVIVTDVKPGKEAAYRAWSDRIQKVQDTFAGFSGSYTQPPKDGQHTWTTLLRFDTIDNLEAWLNSTERSALIAETSDLVDRVLTHRVDSTFPGWVPTDPRTGKGPKPWQTGSLVLLTLFPVVMLEIRFLSPHLEALHPALATFIGNALSVALTTWPLMPLAVRAFRWWLFAERSPRWVAFAGPAIVIALYALEIVAFWPLLGAK